MSRGKRYDEPKLNMKKVFAVIIAFIVFIMCIFMIKGLLTKDKEQGKITSKDYFAVFKDDKWGVIDSNGNTVITPSYKEMIIVPNSKKDVFLCTYDVNYDENTYKTKALNSKNEEKFTEYEKIESVPNTDKNGNMWYEPNVLKIQKNGKYGLIDYEGKEKLACEYEKIETIPGIEKVYKVTKDNKSGVFDETGKTILKLEYQNIKALGKEAKEGFIIKNSEGKEGIIDYFGNIVIEPKYEEVSNKHKKDYFIVKQDGKQKLIKKDGSVVLENGYDEILDILEQTQEGIIFKKDQKIGVMKLDQQTIIEPKYEDIKEGRNGTFIAKKDGKYGIIDLEGKNKVDFKYTSIVYYKKANIIIAQDEEYNDKILDDEYNEKLAGIVIDLDEEKEYLEIRQNDEYKYYNFKFEEKKESEIYDLNTIFLEKKNGKYGFVDKKRNVVVDYEYEDATRQNSFGFAGIKKDGKWGVVDKKGNIIVEPKYNLDEYLKIDFIGIWHLGKDLNMNYYNQL